MRQTAKYSCAVLTVVAICATLWELGDTLIPTHSQRHHFTTTTIPLHVIDVIASEVQSQSNPPPPPFFVPSTTGIPTPREVFRSSTKAGTFSSLLQHKNSGDKSYHHPLESEKLRSLHSKKWTFVHDHPVCVMEPYGRLQLATANSPPPARGKLILLETETFRDKIPTEYVSLTPDEHIVPKTVYIHAATVHRCNLYHTVVRTLGAASVLLKSGAPLDSFAVVYLDVTPALNRYLNNPLGMSDADAISNCRGMHLFWAKMFGLGVPTLVFNYEPGGGGKNFITALQQGSVLPPTLDPTAPPQRTCFHNGIVGMDSVRPFAKTIPNAFHMMRSNAAKMLLKNDVIHNNNKSLRIVFLIRKHQRILYGLDTTLANSVRESLCNPGAICTVTPVVLESIETLEKQMEIVTEVDILVGMQGAGLTWCVAMKPGSVLVEFNFQQHSDAHTNGVDVNKKSLFGALANVAQIRHVVYRADNAMVRAPPGMSVANCRSNCNLEIPENVFHHVMKQALCAHSRKLLC